VWLCRAALPQRRGLTALDFALIDAVTNSRRVFISVEASLH
jgi:hypothetical protein